MKEKEFSDELLSKLEKIDIKITQKSIEQLYKYMEVLLEWNQNINLTAITEPKEIILKHFIDSITISKYIKGVENVIDVGTGAGFPGIPLKIINENVKFVLMDSLNKRILFLKELSQILNLEGIECLHARAEELANDEKHREQYDVVTSRAVARLSTLLEYMLPFVKLGGRCICMKGSNYEEELEEAKKAINILGGELERVENFVLPDSDIERSIIVIKKINKTSKKYPRKAGTPSKQPLV